jgi:hypothetical protein
MPNEYRYLTLNIRLINGETERHYIEKEKYPNFHWQWDPEHEGYHPAYLTIVYQNDADEEIHRYHYLTDKIVGVEVTVTNKPEPF